LIAPASPLAATLLTNKDFVNANILGFLDQNKILHGKKINEVEVYDYKITAKLAPELIFVPPA
jgi:hypothetical protein